MTTLDLTMDKTNEAITVVQLAITGLKLLIATSPLIALFYVLYTGFKSEYVHNRGGDWRWIRVKI